MKCVLLLFLILESQSNCDHHLMDQTDQFIAYLWSLVDQNLVKEAGLLRFSLELKKGRVVNPITSDQKRTVLELHEPYEEFEKYIRGPGLDLSKISEWVESKITSLHQTKVARDHTKVMTKDPHLGMKFYPIPRGEFLMGNHENDVKSSGQQVKVKLSHDFEMMSTKVTQKMWMDLMRANPSFHQGDLDYPVENITWWSAVVYANKLSEKQGYKPAYDLSGIKWDAKTSASKGTLLPELETLARLEFDKHNKNIYETEGYRLPTDAEAEYVRRDLGRALTQYHFGNDEQELKKYAWHHENSKGVIHPVAELLPLKINGNPFYDLHGLLFEWCSNLYGDGALEEGVDPKGPALDNQRVMRGGAYVTWADGISSDDRAPVNLDYKSKWLGFRLVRTLPSQTSKL